MAARVVAAAGRLDPSRRAHATEVVERRKPCGVRPPQDEAERENGKTARRPEGKKG
jgi:hypothetical protein